MAGTTKPDAPPAKKATKKPTKKRRSNKNAAGGKNPRKPKRPMTAYNFFFQEERRRILAGEDPSLIMITGKGSKKKKQEEDERKAAEEAEEGEKAGKEKGEGEGTDEKDDSKDSKGPDGKEGAANKDDKDAKDKEGGEDSKPKRSITFEDLGRIIGQRWRSIPSDDLAKYTALAEQDSKRYRREMKKFYEEEVAVMCRGYNNPLPPGSFGGEGGKATDADAKPGGMGSAASAGKPATGASANPPAPMVMFNTANLGAFPGFPGAQVQPSAAAAGQQNNFADLLKQLQAGQGNAAAAPQPAPAQDPFTAALGMGGFNAAAFQVAGFGAGQAGAPGMPQGFNPAAMVMQPPQPAAGGIDLANLAQNNAALLQQLLGQAGAGGNATQGAAAPTPGPAPGSAGQPAAAAPQGFPGLFGLSAAVHPNAAGGAAPAPGGGGGAPGPAAGPIDANSLLAQALGQAGQAAPAPGAPAAALNPQLLAALQSNPRAFLR